MNTCTHVHSLRQLWIGAAATLLCCAVALRAEQRRLTLEEAVNLACDQNALIKIARLRVEESRRKSLVSRADFFPQITNSTNYWQVIEKYRLDIPRGVFGVYPGIGPIPASPLTIEQGGKGLFFTSSSIAQPLTQLIKIRQGHRVAEADTRIAEAELSKAENEIAYRVRQIYFGWLITQKQKLSSEARILAAEEKLKDSQTAVESGNLLQVAVIGMRASLLESRQELLGIEDQISDLTSELDDLLHLPLETQLELAPVPPGERQIADLQTYVNAALEKNPEIREALQTAEKARRGVLAAKADYIPDVSLFGLHLYQNSVPFFPRNNEILGFTMNWKVFDFGKRRAAVAARESAHAAAVENIERLRARATLDVEKGFRKLQRARRMTEVAREALDLRYESRRISSDQHEAGVLNRAGYLEAVAAAAKAEADFLQAELGFRLAKVELERSAGIAFSGNP